MYFMDLKTFEEVYGTKRVRTLKYNRISTFSGCNSREDKCVENKEGGGSGGTDAERQD